MKWPFAQRHVSGAARRWERPEARTVRVPRGRPSSAPLESSVLHFQPTHPVVGRRPVPLCAFPLGISQHRHGQPRICASPAQFTAQARHSLSSGSRIKQVSRITHCYTAVTTIHASLSPKHVSTYAYLHFPHAAQRRVSLRGLCLHFPHFFTFLTPLRVCLHSPCATQRRVFTPHTQRRVFSLPTRRGCAAACVFTLHTPRFHT